MKNISLIFTALLIVCAVGAWAEPTACPPQRDWQPAGLGAGPAAILTSLSGCDFDSAYISTQYQQQSDIARLASYGSEKLTDPYLKSFSEKMARERNDQNVRLASVPGCFPGGAGPAATPEHASVITSQLADCSGDKFNRVWVLSMMAALRQSKQAADLAVSRASTPALRNQAANASKTSGNELRAFKLWLDTGFLTHQDYERYCTYNYMNDPRCF